MLYKGSNFSTNDCIVKAHQFVRSPAVQCILKLFERRKVLVYKTHYLEYIFKEQYISKYL